LLTRSPKATLLKIAAWLLFESDDRFHRRQLAF